MNIGDYQINIATHTTVTVEPFRLRARVQNHATRRAGERELFSKGIACVSLCHADKSDAKQ